MSPSRPATCTLCNASATPARVGVPCAVLLTEHTVLGIRLGDHVAQRVLDLEVRRSDRRGVGLVDQPEGCRLGAEIAPSDRSRAIGKALGKRAQHGKLTHIDYDFRLFRAARRGGGWQRTGDGRLQATAASSPSLVP